MAWNFELLLMLALSVPAGLAIITTVVLMVIKKRLEKSRETALAAGERVDLSGLNRIERAIYTSEIFWKDATGIIQDRLFRQLGYLVESVDRFNRSLSEIPRTVDNRIPPAVAMVGSALEDSAGVFRSASNSFQRAAENIVEYGEGYKSHFDRLRQSMESFGSAQHQFEIELRTVLNERLLAERNLTKAINEKAESIRTGKLIIAPSVDEPLVTGTGTGLVIR
jgi:hypothetical protein